MCDMPTGSDQRRRRSSTRAVRVVGALMALWVAVVVLTAAVKNKRESAYAPPPKAAGAAGLIALAEHQLESGNLATAGDYASAAATKVPSLSDYAHYIRAQAEYGLRNYGEVAKPATQVFNQVPASPFVGAAAALAVRADLEGDHPKDALDLVRKYYDVIPQPQSHLLLARAFAATGDLAQAAEHYRRVYYDYPTAKEATDAAN